MSPSKSSEFTKKEQLEKENKKGPLNEQPFLYLERETRFELATSTLARLRSTN